MMNEWLYIENNNNKIYIARIILYILKNTFNISKLKKMSSNCSKIFK